MHITKSVSITARLLVNMTTLTTISLETALMRRCHNPFCLRRHEKTAK